MKRNSFLKLCIIAAAGIVAPIKLFAQKIKKITKGFKVAAGKNRFDNPISLFEGDTFTTKVSSKDNDGDIYMFESVRIKNGGPPLHYHPEQDEWWYVLSGEFLIKIGEETYTAKAGDSVYGPRNIPHAFAKTNEGEAKLLMFFQPAGRMEEWFTLVSSGTFKHLSETELNAKRKEYGFVVTGPALTHLKQ